MIMWELVSESLDREIQMLGGEGSFEYLLIMDFYLVFFRIMILITYDSIWSLFCFFQDYDDVRVS